MPVCLQLLDADARIFHYEGFLTEGTVSVAVEPEAKPHNSLLPQPNQQLQAPLVRHNVQPPQYAATTERQHEDAWLPSSGVLASSATDAQSTAPQATCSCRLRVTQ